MNKDKFMKIQEDKDLYEKLKDNFKDYNFNFVDDKTVFLYKNENEILYVLKQLDEEMLAENYLQKDYLPKLVSKFFYNDFNYGLFEYIKGAVYDDLSNEDKNKADLKIVDHLIDLKRYQIATKKDLMKLKNKHLDYMVKQDSQIDYLASDVLSSINRRQTYLKHWNSVLNDDKNNQFFTNYQLFLNYKPLSNVRFKACLNHNDLHNKNIIFNETNCFFIDNVLFGYGLVGYDVMVRLSLFNNKELLKKYLESCDIDECNTLYMLMYDYACEKLCDLGNKIDTKNILKKQKATDSFVMFAKLNEELDGLSQDFNNSLGWLDEIKKRIDFLKKANKIKMIVDVSFYEYNFIRNEMSVIYSNFYKNKDNLIKLNDYFNTNVFLKDLWQNFFKYTVSAHLEEKNGKLWLKKDEYDSYSVIDNKYLTYFITWLDLIYKTADYWQLRSSSDRWLLNFPLYEKIQDDKKIQKEIKQEPKTIRKR